MVRRNYARRVGTCIACLVLTINLVCTSYTRVKAAPVAGYAIEEVVAALLVSLGITGATGEALNKAGLTPESVRTILNSIYASAKEFSRDTDEAIDQTIMGAIADAAELGKIVFKQGSKAWDALKEWAKSVGADIKGLIEPTAGVIGDSSYYKFNDVAQNEQFMLYVEQIVNSMYASVGYTVPPSNDDFGSGYRSYSCGNYFLLYTIYFWTGSYYTYNVYGVRADTFEELNYKYKWIQEKLKDEKEDVKSEFTTYAFWTRKDTSIHTSETEYGKLVGVHLLSPSEFRVWQNYGIPDLSMSDAYQTVYNPAIPDTTDVVTPSNTITREKDGSIAVTGDRTIDVALPVAWPVDLTKGIVIGRDIPIENVLDNTKTDEKTDGKDDNKEEENKPPITPDLPSGAVGDNLEADLKSIFPFCIPFDLIACIKGLAADPEAPVWNIKIPMPTNYTWAITIDMSDYDGVVRIFRIGEDLLFIVGLIVITRNLIRG